ncbi:Hsp70 family protein [Micromonospora ureilytica]|uniref:Hsp70 family protein n=1 Tax=Micromonospora ureilytica TaxID=709868 RepID=UPI002E160A31|nr:Hsp70 family protein [Micromonospora ureilytica]
MGGAHGHAVGVDFGTSTSLVATRAGRRPVEIAPLGRTTRWFPSLAGYRGETLLVGEDADALPSDQVIRSIKRAITDNQETVSLPGPGGLQTVSADDVMIALLAEIGERAARAGEPLTADREFRLGCPAMWDGPQRQRLLDLAAKAGLPVDDSALVDEPIAAGIAWVTHRFLAHGERPEGRLLVFDMGGGTLDIAVLDVVGGAHPEISVLTALGTAYAGDALDHAIARDLLEGLGARGVDLEAVRHPELLRALVLRAARDAKVSLSRLPEHRIVLPSRQIGHMPVLTYSREQLEEAFREQINNAEQLVWAALRAAQLTERGSRSPSELRAMGPAELSGDIDYVLLAGGMSRIPYVERRIGALFPNAQVFDNAGVQPDEAIVAGLADTASYERLNLHRPGFDFVVEWEEGGQVRQEILYAAYTPFYEPWQVLTGQSNLGYERRDRAFPGPQQGIGRLRVRATSGEPLGLKFDGQVMDGLRLNFGHKMIFKLYCDGRILIQHGSGSRIQMRVDRWPVIRGRDHAQLVLRSAEESAPTPPTPWYMEKEWAPPIR